MLTPKMVAALAAAKQELQEAKSNADAARKAVWEAHMALDKAKATIAHKKAKLASLEREAGKQKPPKAHCPALPPILLSVTSPAGRKHREHTLGAFEGLGQAFHKIREWQALGKQAEGARFYVTFTGKKEGSTIVVVKPTPFIERYPGLAKKLYAKGVQPPMHVT